MPRRLFPPAVVVMTAVFVLLSSALPPLESATPKPQHKVTYILPTWLGYQGASDAEFTQEVGELRRRIGEGRFVRVGFSLYIEITMNNWSVDPNDQATIARELAPVVSRIDRAVDRARANGIPIAINLQTANRQNMDPVQAASQRDDRRNMQWYADNGLASGWWTVSRYARKQRRLQEAYVREIAKVVANRMARFPSTLVAATGDGEMELAFHRSPIGDPSIPVSASVLADYSPFVVLEFSHWIRNAGLYAPGQPFEGQGYDQASRYAGDQSPASDSNGDGRTFNGDFGTGFSTWDLRYFHWSLSDPVDPDPNRIPASTYETPGWNALPDAGSARFDAPRNRQPGHPFWELWVRFKQTMIWRHNVEFARWMTTTPDPETGLRVPAERWFSNQIPADYIFGGTPQNPTFRLDTSASPWWTADISPYGGLGITAFNTNDNGRYGYTLRNVAPVIAERRVRWGVIEFHPSVPTSNSIDVYREDMAIIERHRPALIMPIYWGDSYYQIQNTPFELALKELVDRIKDGPPSGVLNELTRN